MAIFSPRSFKKRSHDKDSSTPDVAGRDSPALATPVEYGTSSSSLEGTDSEYQDSNESPAGNSAGSDTTYAQKASHTSLNYQKPSLSKIVTSSRQNDAESFSIYGSSPSTPNRRSPTKSPVQSIHSRRISDIIKVTPASLVRHSRVYSFSEGNTPQADPFAGSLLSRNRALTENLPKELIPVVNLLNAQKLRTYASGVLHVPGILETGERVWLEVEAKLCGNELSIWRPSDSEVGDIGNDEFTPKYINLTDSRIEIVKASGALGYEIKIYQDYQNDNSLLIRFDDSEQYNLWLAAIYLSKYEYTSLNEAFTAVILSLKAPKLSDIHLLLAPKKRFAHQEWCHLRLPQVSNKWIKVWVVITPGESKKKGRIEIFSSEKTTKKNLLMYIPSVSHVFNVYPENPEIIDANSIMKLNGNIYVNKNHEQFFDHQNQANYRSSIFKSPSRSRSNSGSSLTSLPSPTQGHHQRTSSASSFFNMPDLGNPKRTFSGNSLSSLLNTPSQKSSLSRSPSQTPVDASEPKRTSSFLKKNMSNFVATNHLYLMPASHPGVPPVETLIRNFMHIIDAFKLYGRPKHLASDKTDIQSMLFALPSLPHFKYLSVEDLIGLVESSPIEQWSELELNNAIKSVLVQKLEHGNYKGSGDISKLYGNLDYNYEEISSPRITMPQTDLEFDNLSDMGMVSPIESEQNSNLFGNDSGVAYTCRNNYLGDPVQLNDRPLQNDYMNYRDRPLAPIQDLPTPLADAQFNFVGVKNSE